MFRYFRVPVLERKETGQVQLDGADHNEASMEFSVESLETPALTKAQLAQLLFERIGLNKRESKEIIDAFFDLIVEQLIEGIDVKISGFGNFQIRTKPPRPGRNPRTGQAIPIQSRRVVTFHASHKLKETIQGLDRQAN